ncbi:MAG: ribosome maturation factor RimM [Oscillospiraceae bacterium]|nr:ribosome maturation factor RimM [Oscillospiraceae bacterium]
MGKQFLEAGKIVNTHGIRGEIKITPWCDTPEFLRQFDRLYLDGIPYPVQQLRVYKGSVLVKLEGVDSVDAAAALKGRVVCIDRSQAQLPEGRHFLADLIGLEVREAESGQVLGVLSDVLNLPASDVYVVQGEREYMVPAVDEFLVETNIEGGYIRLRILEGMEL